jgi:uncharacterized membrane protein
MTTAHPVAIDADAMSELTSTYNVIAVTFEDGSNAYGALTALKELDSQQRVGLQEAVVVVRDETGATEVKDRVEPTSLPATVGGSLIGLLLGVIGGPFGVLIGGYTGLLVGSMFDLYDLDETESALGAISSSVKPGSTALLAVVEERTSEVVDTAMSATGGTVVRRPVADVEAEIAAAEDVERKAKADARKELVKQRREQSKATVHAKLDQLKAKLHREPTPAA